MIPCMQSFLGGVPTRSEATGKKLLHLEEFDGHGHLGLVFEFCLGSLQGFRQQFGIFDGERDWHVLLLLNYALI